MFWLLGCSLDSQHGRGAKCEGSIFAVFLAVGNRHDAFKHASDQLRSEKLFILQVVSLRGRSLKYAAVSLKGDIDVARAAVHQTGEAIAYVAEELRNDPDLALVAVRNFPKALFFVSDACRDMKPVVLEAVQGHAVAYLGASKDLKCDEHLTSLLFVLSYLFILHPFILHSENNEI